MDELFEQFTKLFEDCANDYPKTQSGVKAAIVRMRKNLLEIKKLTVPMRKELLSKKNEKNKD